MTKSQDMEGTDRTSRQSSLPSSLIPHLYSRPQLPRGASSETHEPIPAISPVERDERTMNESAQPVSALTSVTPAMITSTPVGGHGSARIYSPYGPMDLEMHSRGASMGAAGNVPMPGVRRAVESEPMPAGGQRYGSPIYSDPIYHISRPYLSPRGPGYDASPPAPKEGIMGPTWREWQEGEAGPSSVTHGQGREIHSRISPHQATGFNEQLEAFSRPVWSVEELARFQGGGSLAAERHEMGIGGQRFYEAVQELPPPHGVFPGPEVPSMAIYSRRHEAHPLPPQLTSGLEAGVDVVSAIRLHATRAETASAEEGESSKADIRRESVEADNSTRKAGNVRKTAVACNFCRGRKLRCNGARPLCQNCSARKLECEYVASPRRRGPGKAKKGAGNTYPIGSVGITTCLSDAPRLPWSRLCPPRPLTPMIPADDRDPPATDTQRAQQQQHDIQRLELTLLVAGSRGGKTSFLRLFLDTCEISPLASPDQLHSVAKFVQASSGHTSYLKSASIDINLDLDAPARRLTLTLIDTPSLDFTDNLATERIVAEMLRHIDQRFLDGLDDERKAQSGDRFVHLCIYFLDPDQIISPSIPGPPAPPVPRTRANSFSQPEQEPVILDPPVATNPLLTRATLPPADISTIRRLSARVNVLPVIARADLLSNERLAAIKVAIRKDLADAGIGFGIFDLDTQYPRMSDDHPPSIVSDAANGFGTHPNGTASAHVTPPTSPVAPLLRLPYALISPDIYSHSDGVPRPTPSRHELFNQYNPSSQHLYPPGPRLTRGKYLRSYRWGSLDVLDLNHCDFVPLRNAIFHHMETLQKYTRDYLFEKFRADVAAQRPSSRHSLPRQVAQPIHLGPITHPTRPILAIDTAPLPTVHRHPPIVPHREVMPGETHAISRLPIEPLSSASPGKSSTPRSSRPRTKKITVACNFCRSRKLKCDGGRPACGQCTKRSNSCDYMPQTKRRGTRQRKGDESESESAEDKSADPDEPSPDSSGQTVSKRNSNVKPEFQHPLPPMGQLHERRGEIAPNIPSSSRSNLPIPPAESRPPFFDNELPRIATLSLPDPSPATPAPMSAPSLPPIRPASEQQATQRRRSSTVPGKTTRPQSGSGPKVVACNFCRARKTKCDGAHPACASCARRLLPCNYVHDHTSAGGPAPKRSRRSSISRPLADESPQSVSPPSSRMIPTPSTAQDSYVVVEEHHLEGELDMKRPMVVEYPEGRPNKKMKVESNPAIPTL
ncbi:hypothetical protein APHAL10511_002675 [Amanita phalloides]|nr:hypothetical protein APHAL10511_002675 [Amanita phalloides]